MTTAGYPDLVTDINIHFQAEMETRKPSMVGSLFTQQPWTDGDPEKMTFDTYALPMYARRTAQGEAAPQYSVTMGNKLVKYFFKYAIASDYTVEMDTFGRERIISKMMDSFAPAILNSKELEMTHQILTYADALTYTPQERSAAVDWTTPDGLAVGSASHTVPGTGTKTYSNILSAASPLTPSSLTSLLAQLQRNTVNDEGRIIPLDYDTLVITGDWELQKRAFEILASNKIPMEANNTINVYSGGGLQLPFGNSPTVGADAGYKPIKLVVLNKGALDANGQYADTVNSSENRRYYWGVMASELFPSNKYAETTNSGVIKVGPSNNNPNAMFGLMAYQFAVYGITRWQGKGYSFAKSL
jgi:hypothetical protein